MSKEHEIKFGAGARCSIELESASAEPAPDPELTVSKHPVHGLKQGELSVLVTRTQAPMIVNVKVAERGTGLPQSQLEEIRSSAERILRSQAW